MKNLQTNKYMDIYDIGVKVPSSYTEKRKISLISCLGKLKNI